MTILLAIWALIEPFKEWIAGGVAGLVGILVARNSGKNAEKRAQLERDAKARTVADKIDDAVAGRSEDENRRRLQRWTRKP